MENKNIYVICKLHVRQTQAYSHARTVFVSADMFKKNRAQSHGLIVIVHIICLCHDKELKIVTYNLCKRFVQGIGDNIANCPALKFKFPQKREMISNLLLARRRVLLCVFAYHAFLIEC